MLLALIIRSLVFFALMPYRLLVEGDTRLGREKLEFRCRRRDCCGGPYDVQRLGRDLR